MWEVLLQTFREHNLICRQLDALRLAARFICTNKGIIISIIKRTFKKKVSHVKSADLVIYVSGSLLNRK